MKRVYDTSEKVESEEIDILETKDGYSLVTAKLDHFLGVKAISKDIYDGCDYLLHIYAKWMQNPRRINYALLDQNGKIIGFLSYEMFCHGAFLHAQALRIEASLAGKGISKLLRELSYRNLEEKYQVAVELKDVADSSLPPRARLSGSSTGKVILSKLRRNYVIEDVDRFCAKIEENAQKIRMPKEVKTLGDFANLAKKKQLFLYQDNYLLVHWVR